MGIVVSTNIPTSPFFVTSGVVGFVSFAFTLGTFFRVVWGNLDTLCEAPHEVHSYLTNLRTELLEEKASLKMMRKGMRKHRKQAWKEKGGSVVGMELDEVTLKTMSDTVRQLIKRFQALERPFLDEGEPGIRDAANHRKRVRRRNSSPSPPHYDHAAYSSPPVNGRQRSRARNDHDREKDERMEDEMDEDAYWAQRTSYADFTLKRRLTWLKKKSTAQSLTGELSRVQIRRMARQVGGIVMLVHEYGCGTLELNEAVRRIDERVSRVVGVRRVE